MTRVFFLTLSILFSIIVSAADSLTVESPVSRIVYQRNIDNTAKVFVSGKYPQPTTTVQARLVPRVKGQGKRTKWITLNLADGTYSGELVATGGWYNLEVVAKQKRKQIAETKLERVGVGEVFVVVGHSVAQGGEINLGGAEDDRVNTVAANNKTEVFEKQYLTTGDLQYLPPVSFSHASTGVAHAPFGHNTYFWSKFGDYVVKKYNVPVLIYNAAFGGTSLEHWAKSSQGIDFEHGFVRSKIRMPYINLYNTLVKYIPATGVRAILADQGQNDAGRKNADTVFADYQTFVKQARQDLGYDQLTVVVNRQTPDKSPHIRQVQERMLKEPYTFPGPDYDKGLITEDRYDGIHLSESGLKKAAVMWAEALTPEFFRTVIPWIPNRK